MIDFSSSKTRPLSFKLKDLNKFLLGWLFILLNVGVIGILQLRNTNSQSHQSTASAALTASITFSHISINHQSSTSTQLVWATDIPTQATITYGPNQTNLDQSKRINELTQFHTIILDKLQPNTRYYLHITAISQAGDQLTSPQYNFKTKP